MSVTTRLLLVEDGRCDLLLTQEAVQQPLPPLIRGWLLTGWRRWPFWGARDGIPAPRGHRSFCRIATTPGCTAAKSRRSSRWTANWRRYLRSSCPVQKIGRISWTGAVVGWNRL